MRIYKPSKNDIVTAVVAGLILVGAKLADSMVVNQYLGQYLAKVPFSNVVSAAVVGLILATVLAVVGMGKYAPLAFILPVAVAVANEVQPMVMDMLPA